MKLSTSSGWPHQGFAYYIWFHSSKLPRLPPTTILSQGQIQISFTIVYHELLPSVKVILNTLPSNSGGKALRGGNLIDCSANF